MARYMCGSIVTYKENIGMEINRKIKKFFGKFYVIKKKINLYSVLSKICSTRTESVQCVHIAQFYTHRDRNIVNCIVFVKIMGIVLKMQSTPISNYKYIFILFLL